METEKTSPSNTLASREERFVQQILQRCQEDKGAAARLRRADNQATEYQSWDLLAAFGVDLENENQRLPFATVAAIIAKSKSENNGSQTLGGAIAACYEEGRASNQARTRLRRLLACHELPEVCRNLRPLFSLIDSKTTRPVDFTRVLKQLRRFSFEDARIKVKAQWAQEFYGHPAGEQTGGQEK